MTEVWDLVDKYGQSTGVICPREDRYKIPDGLYFPCVEIWVTVGDKLLITRRHPQKREGLKYDLPGGAVVSGENMIDGAIRELYEEVGIKADKDSLFCLGSIIVDKAFATSYLLRLDFLPKITLQLTEVVDCRLVTKAEIERMTDELTEGTHKRYLLY